MTLLFIFSGVIRLRDAQFIDLVCHGVRHFTGIGRSARHFRHHQASNQRRTHHRSHVHFGR